MFKPIRSVVETIVKRAPFCIPTCSLRLVLSFLSGPLHGHGKWCCSILVPMCEIRWWFDCDWDYSAELSISVKSYCRWYPFFRKTQLIVHSLHHKHCARSPLVPLINSRLIDISTHYLLRSGSQHCLLPARTDRFSKFVAIKFKPG